MALSISPSSAKANLAKSKLSLLSKLKGFGVIGAVLVLAGVAGWGIIQKKQKEAYRSEVSEQEVKAITVDRKLHEAKLDVLKDMDLALKTGTLFLDKGKTAFSGGFMHTRKQTILRSAAIKFQNKYEPTLKTAVDEKLIAFEARDKAKRGNTKWKVITVGALGLVAGIALF